MYMCMHKYVKCSLLNPFWLVVCSFRLVTLHWTANAGPIPGTGQLSLSQHHLSPVVLCPGLGPHRNLPSSTLVSTNSAVVLVLFVQPFPGESVSADFLGSRLLQPFCLPWCSLRCVSGLDCPYLLTPALHPVVVFCDDLIYCEKLLW